MKIFDAKKTVLDDKRSIKKAIYDGETCYLVNFRKTIKVDKYIFGHLVSSHNDVVNVDDDTLFETIEGAEWYAKNTRRYYIYEYDCNGWRTWMDGTIYFIGDDAINQYGHFKIQCNNKGLIRKGSFEICFIFKYDRYHQQSISLGIVNNFDDYTAKKCVDYVLDKCGNFNEDDKVVKSFDIITMDTVPIDKLNASTKELAELRTLVDRFHEDQKAYAELTTKLLASNKQI